MSRFPHSLRVRGRFLLEARGPKTQYYAMNPAGDVTRERVSYSEDDTRNIACEFGLGLSAGDQVCLTGPLGAGKTTFCRGVAEGLGIDPTTVTSPTFAIAHEYSPGARGVRLTHIDLYRIATPAEALAIGWESYLAQTGVLLVEWADNAPGILPRPRWDVSIERLPETRRISIRRVE